MVDHWFHKVSHSFPLVKKGRKNCSGGERVGKAGTQLEQKKSIRLMENMQGGNCWQKKSFLFLNFNNVGMYTNTNSRNLKSLFGDKVWANKLRNPVCDKLRVGFDQIPQMVIASGRRYLLGMLFARHGEKLGMQKLIWVWLQKNTVSKKEGTNPGAKKIQP